MNFFDELDSFQPPDPEPEPARVRWHGDLEDTLGAPVEIAALLAINGDAAVYVSDLCAYPTGFNFSLTAVSRLSPPKTPIGHFHPRLNRDQDARQELRFGIQFSDGSKVLSNFYAPMSEASSSWFLRGMGGHGGGRTWVQRFWCEPLPLPGPMAFVCRWGQYEIDESRTEVDGSLIVEAASRARALWPDDRDLPEDARGPRGRPGSGWNSSAFGRRG